MSDKNEARRAAEVVEHSQRALASGNVEGYVACFTPDAVLIDPAVPPMTGHEEIRRGAQALVELFKNPELTELKLFPVGHTVAFKVTLRFDTPRGRRASLEAIDVFELNEDFKIYKGRSYYDLDQLTKELQQPPSSP